MESLVKGFVLVVAGKCVKASSQQRKKEKKEPQKREGDKRHKKEGAEKLDIKGKKRKSRH